MPYHLPTSQFWVLPSPLICVLHACYPAGNRGDDNTVHHFRIPVYPLKDPIHVQALIEKQIGEGVITHQTVEIDSKSTLVLSTCREYLFWSQNPLITTWELSVSLHIYNSLQNCGELRNHHRMLCSPNDVLCSRRALINPEHVPYLHTDPMTVPSNC